MVGAGNGSGYEVLLAPAPADFGTLAGCRFVGDVYLHDKPACEVGERPQYVVKWQVAFTRFGPQVVAAALPIVFAGGLAPARDCHMDVLQMDGTDPARVAVDNVGDIGPGPGQVAGVGSEEQQLGIDLGQHTIDLFWRLDESPHVLVQARVYAFFHHRLGGKSETFN